MAIGWGLRCFWRRQRRRNLRWDGMEWFLLEPEHDPVIEAASPGEVRVQLDLQQCLLLRWHGQPGRQLEWLWADSASDPQRWHLLRCALYSNTSGPGHLPEADVRQRA